MTTTEGQINYRGRFAPSPTGPLHFGSLIAATGSYLQAKSRQGEWGVRIDDIDPPREVAGASDNILATLEQFGFEWDGPVTYQSRRSDVYHAALEVLKAGGAVYPCACSRKQITDAQQPLALHKSIYPGTCRNGLAKDQTARTLRINTTGVTIEFEDRVQGHHRYPLETSVGDFVVLRADGLFAYQLATGVDDARQGITEVVRGSDLLDSTPCQILVQQGLGLSSPAYAHLPIIANEYGQKLSKQNRAKPIDPEQAPIQLWQALMFLGQNPPAELRHEPLNTLWYWARTNWQADKIPKQRTIRLSDIAPA